VKFFCLTLTPHKIREFVKKILNCSLYSHFFFVNFTVEMQVRETTYGQVSKLSALQQQKTDAKSHTVHTPSGQSLFEIHIQKANLTKECLLQLGTNEPLIFATWTFYEHDMQYTPVIKGPQALLDCSAYYKVKLDDAFLDFLMDSSVMVEIHMTSNTSGDANGEQCKTVGKAELKLAEVVHYPSNKLHGSVLINSSPISGSHRYIFLGRLKFGFINFRPLCQYSQSNSKKVIGTAFRVIIQDNFTFT
jgi:hypothetical protein